MQEHSSNENNTLFGETYCCFPRPWGIKALCN